MEKTNTIWKIWINKCPKCGKQLHIRCSSKDSLKDLITKYYKVVYKHCDIKDNKQIIKIDYDIEYDLNRYAKGFRTKTTKVVI